MRQEDMERFAFLFLCGERDKALLAGKEEMKFSDFERLSYITDFLELSRLNIEIFNQFSGQFEERLAAFSRMIEQEDQEPEEYADDTRIQEEWLAGFCNDAPRDEARKYLRSVMRIESKENEQTDGP